MTDELTRFPETLTDLDRRVNDIIATRSRQAVASYEQHGAGMTLVEYITMIVVEYEKIRIDTYA